MDTNDFLGSIAQEDVSFTVQVVKTSEYGQNYRTLMIFVEGSRYITGAASSWETAPGFEDSDGIKVLVVTADTYANYTTGLLQSWLTDYFVNTHAQEVILCTCGADIGSTTTDNTDPGNPVTVTRGVADFVADMTKAYEQLKVYAYFKTVLADTDTEGSNYAAAALALAKLCYADRDYLSAAPLLPLSKLKPSESAAYTSISADAAADAIMVYHQDTTRNAALYCLGLAMSLGSNASGTVVGNQLEMISTSNITASTNAGKALTVAEQDVLKAANVGYFKNVGDNSGACANMVSSTLKGDAPEAYWAKAYITYMVKVDVAKLLTQPRTRRSQRTYSQIVTVLSTYLAGFTGDDGIFTSSSVTAPSFDKLDFTNYGTMTIPNAWTATYVGLLKRVVITGTLYIEA